MNRELAEAVVGCLRLAGEAPDVSRLRQFKARDWQRTFRWLDTSGLTLRLLRRLQDLEATEVLPPATLTRFERNARENRSRLDYIANQFASINQTLHRAGINFAVIKGFSLVPAFCPEAALRAPSDLDYLVDKASLPAAQRVLEEAGYRLQDFSDIEFKFVRPSSRLPSTADDPYSRETECLVELHLAFWKQKNCVPLNEPTWLEHTTVHDWQGLRFPVLKEEDAFMLQILHIFQHTLECWVKLCWLLEIGYFLKSRFSDSQFWDRVDARMLEVPCLDEFAAIVVGLANGIFAAPLPLIAAKWTQCARRPARLWLENYGRNWAIQDYPPEIFSGAKLVLFLHREFIPDLEIRKEFSQQRLFPWKRFKQTAVPTNKGAASSSLASRLPWESVWQRVLFHLGSSLRYLVEIPHWQARIKLSPRLQPPYARNHVNSLGVEEK